METTTFTVNIQNTSLRDAPDAHLTVGLSGADDFSTFNNQFFRLLLKYNDKKCIYKYKFLLKIYSNNVTFEKID